MTTTRRNSSLILTMMTLVVLAAVAGCGGDAPPQDPNQMVLRTYDLADDAAGREMRGTIKGVVGDLGETRWLPNGGVAVTAPASLHEGIARMVATVGTGGGAAAAEPARAVSIDCWVVLGRTPLRTPSETPTIEPRVKEALDEVAAIHGGLEFRVIERARLTSVADGSRALLDGRRLAMVQRVVSLDGDVAVADLELQVRNDQRPTRNSVSTRVQLTADRVVVLGRAGYDVSNGWLPPGWESSEDMLLFFVVTASVS